VKIEEMRKEIVDLDVGTLGAKLFLYEGELLYRTETEKLDLMQMLTSSMEELEVKVKEKKKQKAKQKEFKPIKMYLFLDSLLFAKKMVPKSLLESINQSLFQTKGWYKFSAMKSIPLATTVQLEFSTSDPTQFTLTNVLDLTVHTFQAPSALIRDTWTMHFGKTAVQKV